ncbi:hypothetical protein JQK88_31840 [Mesorhizobium caraganae]|uniref:hypothetical protein n=1 Tax=Mesorhizobium caraganae TaxID=483206 RepID=UPI0019395106|nr:hypothetical protein [Mesorhizobium caraganae]MBM2715710.1 hypothetical protein [Mesorhizobium caraganae]
MASLRKILLIVLTSCALTDNHAAAEETVAFKVVVTPSTEATSLRVSGTASDDELADHFNPKGDLVNIPVDPSATSHQLFVIWADGTQTGFPIVATFRIRPQPEEVRLNRVADMNATREVVAKECVVKTPDNRITAFSMFHTCKFLALKLELTNKWSKDHLKAIRGWMIANDYLYGRSSGLALGIDDVLLRKLGEIFESASKEANLDIRPLTLPEVRRILDEGKNQQLQASAVIAGLVAKKQFQNALTANEAALFDLERQHNDGGAVGVTKSQLESNDAWIKQLGRQQPLLSGHIAAERVADDGFNRYTIAVENFGSTEVSLIGNYGCYWYDSAGHKIADDEGVQYPEIVAPLEQNLVIGANTSRTLDYKSLGGLPAAPEDMDKIDLAYQICQIAYSTEQEPKKWGFFEVRRTVD